MKSSLAALDYPLCSHCQKSVELGELCFLLSSLTPPLLLLPLLPRLRSAARSAHDRLPSWLLALVASGECLALVADCGAEASAARCPARTSVILASGRRPGEPFGAGIAKSIKNHYFLLGKRYLLVPRASGSRRWPPLCTARPGASGARPGASGARPRAPGGRPGGGTPKSAIFSPKEGPACGRPWIGENIVFLRYTRL